SPTDDPADLAAMPPMAPPAAVTQLGPAGSAPAPDSGGSAPEAPRRDEPVRPAAATTRDPSDAVREGEPPSTELDPVRDAQQFEATLKRLGGRGGIVRIAALADLDLPAITIEGTGRVQILAEPGARRPRLRFRPGQAVQRDLAESVSMFNV